MKTERGGTVQWWQLLGGVAMMLTPLAAGCGGDSAGDDPKAAFVGNWEYASGTSQVTCPGFPLPPDPATGVLVMQTAGTSLQAVKMLPGANQPCNIQLGTQGLVATATPDQMCTVMAMGFQATLKITSYSFSISGTVMTETGAGTVTPDGFPITCSYTATGMLNKK